jgi:hypothetical protein
MGTQKDEREEGRGTIPRASKSQTRFPYRSAIHSHNLFLKTFHCWCMSSALRLLTLMVIICGHE